MLARRIVPCLDVDRGRVVKGVRFVALRDAGDPVECAARYDAEGADELVLLDITASSDARPILLDVVRRVADAVYLPFTVGGGVRSLDDADALLRAGADKVAVNTAAVHDPTLLTRLAERYGSQAVVLAIDARRTNGEEATETRRRGGTAAAKRQQENAVAEPRGFGEASRLPGSASPGDTPPTVETRAHHPLPSPGFAGRAERGWQVFIRGGRTPTGRDAVEWAREGAARGAGEILLTSMDRDGTRDGFDVDLTRAVAEAVRVPVVASGGCGGVEHMADVLTRGRAAAALAASIFHFGEVRIADARARLRAAGVEVRP